MKKNNDTTTKCKCNAGFSSFSGCGSMTGGNNWYFLAAMSATLTDMDFVSASQGYACGNNGGVYSISGSVTNLNSGLSTNLAGISSPSIDNVWVCGGSNIVYYNGSTFTFQTGPIGSYSSIFFIDNNEGWVVGTAGLIGHTQDGGNNWTSQTNPSDESLFDVFFLTAEVGWSVGSNGTILSTSSGGDTWTVVGSGLTTYLLRGVYFTSPTNGYVVGNDKTLLKYGEILNSVEEIESIQFEIYPNPSKNKIQIHCSEFKTENGIIEILSLDGKIIIKKEIETGVANIELNLNILKSGMYLCKISTDKKSSTKKLIIE